MTTEDGVFSQSGVVYTITAAGTYNLSGKLVGQIVVSAGENDVVELALKGVSITYGSDSPIKILSAKKVEISAKSETGNTVTDSRSKKTVDDENQGEGATGKTG